MPRIRSRRTWRGGPIRAQLHQLGKRSVPIVHHTGGSYGLTERSTPAQEAAVMRAIQAGHRDRGFTDIGYSHVIAPSGRIYAARGWNRAPAAAQYANAGNYHPSLIGNFEVTKPTTAQLRSLRYLLRRFRKRTGSRRPAIGHYQANTVAVTWSPLNQTDCPGKHLKPHVRRLP